VPPEDAAVTARNVDETMKSCILNLYRSAVNAGAEWEPDLRRVKAPGLLLWGEKDPYVIVDFGRRLAERTKARFVLLRDCGHWWPSQRPDDVAAELQAFWAAPR
jgi:pimeloyl-ACP methyl ester carboxylesterase